MTTDRITVCGLCQNNGFEKPTSDPGNTSVCNVATSGSLVLKEGKYDKLDNDTVPTVKAQTPCFVAFATEDGKFKKWKFETRKFV